MKFTVLLSTVSLTLALHPTFAGDITGTITLKGTPPAEKQITPLKDDPNCGKLHTEMPTTHFYVVGSKGELADVIISIQGVTGKSMGASAPPVVLDQKGCEYTPSIFAVQTGQKIVVKNSDPVLHNVHDVPGTGSGNQEENKAQMPNGPDLSFSFSKPEEFLKFKCDVHPWMFAWVTVVDHPYFAVTDKDGKFTIKDVPAGKYKIVALHRKAAPAPGGVEQDVEVKDGEAKADFTLEAK